MKLLVFDSHPVQYRVPVWKEIESYSTSSIHVVYASDCSARGHMDSGFGQEVMWDEPVLAGYSHTILNCDNGHPLSGWSSLTGKGVAEVLDQMRPDVVLLTGLNYRYDLVAYLAALRRRIPVWLRCETQDESATRTALKSMIRSFVYRVAYRGLDRVFYIGKLNRLHYLKHGVCDSRLIPARYGTVNRFEGMSLDEKKQLRADCRRAAAIPEDAFVVGFSGKLIPKKNPDILYQMLQWFPDELRRKTFLYFIGSGELEESLKDVAETWREKWGVGSHFAGFVNQSQLAPHYLAMDVMVLPSRRMGETWGLVCNEAMQAGCSVVVSDAVGCGADFGSWERFRVFPVEDSEGLARSLVDLAKYPFDPDWAAEKLKDYSLLATARAFSSALEQTH